MAYYACHLKISCFFSVPALVRQAVLRKNELLAKKIMGKVVEACIKQAKPNEVHLSLVLAQYQDIEEQ